MAEPNAAASLGCGEVFLVLNTNAHVVCAHATREAADACRTTREAITPEYARSYRSPRVEVMSLDHGQHNDSSQEGVEHA